MHVLPGSYETAGHLQSCTRIMHELGTRLCTCCMLPCFVLPRKHLLSLEWRMGSVTNFVLNESCKNNKKHNGAMSKNFLRHNFNDSFSLLWLLVVILLLSLISLLFYFYTTCSTESKLDSLPFAISVPVDNDNAKFRHSCKDTKMTFPQLNFQEH